MKVVKIGVSIPLSVKTLIQDIKNTISDAKEAFAELKDTATFKANAKKAKGAKDVYEAYFKVYGEPKPRGAKKWGIEIYPINIVLYCKIGSFILFGLYSKKQNNNLKFLILI